MQTPDSSPQQQRKRNSPISTLSRKSWFNLRSKLGSKGQSPPSEKPEFLFLSANVSPRKPSSPKVDFRDLPQKLLRLQSEPNAEGTKHDEQVNAASISNLGEPFDDGLSSNLAVDDCSDAKSQFSFDRSSSCHYYKPSLIDSAIPSLHPNRNYSNASSWISSSSVSDMGYSDIDSIGEDYSLYDHADNGEDLEDADIVADLIAEANMVADDEDLAEALSRQKSSSSSMHRQLSQVTREDLVITFFEETRPKRTRSTISNASTVWPIKE